MVELLGVVTVLVLVAEVGVDVTVKAAGVPTGERTELDAMNGTLLLDVAIAGTSETTVEVELETAGATLTLLNVGIEVMLVLAEICDEIGLVLL